MDVKESVVIIAKFDGWTRVAVGNGGGIWYTRHGASYIIESLMEMYLSLDSLVHVWCKLGYIKVDMTMCPFDKMKSNSVDLKFAFYRDSFSSCEGQSLKDVVNNGLTIQQASCIATAEAIKGIS